MARSLRSKRRRKNKQVMRAKLKPKYDAQLEAIVKTMQEQTDELMETVGGADLSNEVKIIDPDVPVQEEAEHDADMDMEKHSENKDTKKIKIPRVDIKKVAKFMSQRKYRTFQAREKLKKKQLKGGQKKKQKVFKW